MSVAHYRVSHRQCSISDPPAVALAGLSSLDWIHLETPAYIFSHCHNVVAGEFGLLVPTDLGPTLVGPTWVPFPNGTFFRSQISSFRSGAWKPPGNAFRRAQDRRSDEEKCLDRIDRMNSVDMDGEEGTTKYVKIG